jgi:hypothetical protein
MNGCCGKCREKYDDCIVCMICSLEERVYFLEEELDRLTVIVSNISEYIDMYCLKCKTESVTCVCIGGKDEH